MQVKIQYGEKLLHLMERVVDGLADNAINVMRLMRLVACRMIMLDETGNALLCCFSSETYRSIGGETLVFHSVHQVFLGTSGRNPLRYPFPAFPIPLTGALQQFVVLSLQRATNHRCMTHVHVTCA